MERNVCVNAHESLERIGMVDGIRYYAFVNQIIAYIYIRDIAERRREKKEGEGHSRNGLDDVRNK